VLIISREKARSMTEKTIAFNEAWAEIPEERRAIILAGEAATLRKPLDDCIAIGKAFYEVQREAMRQSNSNQPKGRRYLAVYALLELRPEITNLQKHKRDRKATIWLYENEEPVRCWYETLTENQPDRWTHPQTIKQRYERMTRSPRVDNAVVGKPSVKPVSTRDLLKTAEVRLQEVQEKLDAANAKIRLLERENAAWFGRMVQLEDVRMRDLDTANAKIRHLQRRVGEAKLAMRARLRITPQTPPAQIFAKLEAEIPGIMREILPITRKTPPEQILAVLEAEFPGIRTILRRC
jgi:hypothetical protein